MDFELCPSCRCCRPDSSSSRSRLPPVSSVPMTRVTRGYRIRSVFSRRECRSASRCQAHPGPFRSTAGWPAEIHHVSSVASSAEQPALSLKSQSFHRRAACHETSSTSRFAHWTATPVSGRGSVWRSNWACAHSEPTCVGLADRSALDKCRFLRRS